jgi:hypothetical protein
MEFSLGTIGLRLLALWTAPGFRLPGHPVFVRPFQFVASRHFPTCLADDQLELVAISKVVGQFVREPDADFFGVVSGANHALVGTPGPGTVMPEEKLLASNGLHSFSPSVTVTTNCLP